MIDEDFPPESSSRIIVEKSPTHSNLPEEINSNAKILKCNSKGYEEMKSNDENEVALSQKDIVIDEKIEEEKSNNKVDSKINAQEEYNERKISKDNEIPQSQSEIKGAAELEKIVIDDKKKCSSNLKLYLTKETQPLNEVHFFDSDPPLMLKTENNQSFERDQSVDKSFQKYFELYKTDIANEPQKSSRTDIYPHRKSNVDVNRNRSVSLASGRIEYKIYKDKTTEKSEPERKETNPKNPFDTVNNTSYNNDREEDPVTEKYQNIELDPNILNEAAVKNDSKIQEKYSSEKINEDVIDDYDDADLQVDEELNQSIVSSNIFSHAYISGNNGLTKIKTENTSFHQSICSSRLDTYKSNATDSVLGDSQGFARMFDTESLNVY